MENEGAVAEASEATCAYIIRQVVVPQDLAVHIQLATYLASGCTTRPHGSHTTSHIPGSPFGLESCRRTTSAGLHTHRRGKLQTHLSQTGHCSKE